MPQHEPLDEGGQVTGVCLTVCIQGDDDLSAGVLDAVAECITLAVAVLIQDADIWSQAPGHRHGFIGRAAVDQDHLVYTGGYGR